MIPFCRKMPVGALGQRAGSGPARVSAQWRECPFRWVARQRAADRIDRPLGAAVCMRPEAERQKQPAELPLAPVGLPARGGVGGKEPGRAGLEHGCPCSVSEPHWASVTSARASTLSCRSHLCSHGSSSSVEGGMTQLLRRGACSTWNLDP